MKAFLNSTFLWTCAWIVATSAAMTWLIPIDLLKQGDLVGKSMRFQSAADKLGTYFASSKSADILMIGSSLFLYPAIRSDEALDNRPARYDEGYVINDISNYLFARYFEKKLFEESDRAISVANLSTAGGLISDQYHVFRRVCSSGRKPKLLICDISPREFSDQSMGEPTKTPVYSKIVDWCCLNDLFDSHHNTESVSQCLLGWIWSSYRERAAMRNLFVNSAAWLTGHAPDLQSSVDTRVDKQEIKSVERYLSKLLPEKKPSKPLYLPLNTFADDLKHYQFVYTPVKQTMIDTQFVYLERLLADARRENVKVCLVRMPLSEPNLQLLSAKLREEIFAKTKQLAEKYSAVYCSPDNGSNFDLSDFEDSAHLNASGGRKLFDILTAETAQLGLWTTKKIADSNKPL